MLTVEALDFEYPGVRALNNVAFTVAAGSITAVVGPNGAGKTTLLRCLAALDEPLAGTISIAGVDVRKDPRACHRTIGYLSDFFGLYDDLTVERCLLYTAMAHALPADRWQNAVATAAARTGIADRLTAKAGALSRGLRQRLAIAQAIIHEPKLVLLDEPASGLDPEARSALAGLFRALRDGGMTLLVSSHILAELEEYSTDMLILQAGELVDHRRVGGPHSAASALIRFSLASPSADAAAVLGWSPGVEDVRIEGTEGWFRFAGGLEARSLLLRTLVERGVPLCSFSEEKTDMQHEYLAAVRRSRDREEKGS